MKWPLLTIKFNILWVYHGLLTALRVGCHCSCHASIVHVYFMQWLMVIWWWNKQPTFHDNHVFLCLISRLIWMSIACFYKMVAVVDAENCTTFFFFSRIQLWSFRQLFFISDSSKLKEHQTQSVFSYSFHASFMSIHVYTRAFHSLKTEMMCWTLTHILASYYVLDSYSEMFIYLPQAF